MYANAKKMQENWATLNNNDLTIHAHSAMIMFVYTVKRTLIMLNCMALS